MEIFAAIGFIGACLLLLWVGAPLVLWFMAGGLDLSGYLSPYFNSHWKWNRLACTASWMLYFFVWYLLIGASPFTLNIGVS